MTPYLRDDCPDNWLDNLDRPLPGLGIKFWKLKKQFGIKRRDLNLVILDGGAEEVLELAFVGQLGLLLDDRLGQGQHVDHRIFFHF